MAISNNRKIRSSLQRIENHITNHLTINFPFAGQIANHVLSSRGKRLRALATVLTAWSNGKLTPKVEKLAAAIEIFHQATLIHDDVIDRASTRRNHASLNQQFGNEVAVMFGDYLFTKVMNSMVSNMPLEVQKIISQAITHVCIGEVEEIGVRLKYQLSIADYKKIIEHKTAALFGAACESGAILGNHDMQQQKAFKRFGMNIGMAFQIQDDLLDMTGSIRKLGKQPGIDIHEGRVTLPVILAFKKLSQKDQRELKKALSQGMENRMAVKVLLEKSDAIQETKKKAGKYIKQARQALNTLPNSLAKQELLLLAHFSLDREH